MKSKFSLSKHWEENIIILVIALGFIELQTEAIHNIIKWPMLGLCIILFIGCYLAHRISHKINFIIMGTSILVVVELLFSEGILATQYIWDLGICMPIALAFYCCKHFNIKKWIFIYILVTGYLLFRLFTAPDYYSIFYSHSRNYISIFELFLMFMIAIVAYKNNIKLHGWIYYLTTVVCILAVSRGGILAAGMLLAFHVIHNIKTSKDIRSKKQKLFILLLICFALFVVCVLLNDVIIQRIFPRFANSGVESGSSMIAVNKRLWMWGAYIDNCIDSIHDFILGSNPYPIVLEYHYVDDFNLHNSYLMTHVFYGILGELTVLLCVFRFIKYFLKEGSEVCGILIVFLFRALTDHCFPGKLSAIIIWVVIFYAIDRNRVHRR